MLVKYQIEGERMPTLEGLRADLRESGMDVERLEDEVRFRLLADPREHSGRVEDVRRLVTEVSREGGERRWPRNVGQLQLGPKHGAGGGLTATGELSELVEEDPNLVVMTTVLEEEMDGWPGAELRRAQITHSGTVWLSRSGVAMSRVLPPPAL